MKKISVIISTYNRPEKVLETIRCFSEQTTPIEDYAIIVVDNGSRVPVVLPENVRQTDIKLIRFEENQERSISRNTGVNAAETKLIFFSDDDMLVEPDFLEHHIAAHEEWENLLAIGKIILPPERLSEPGIRFRQELELSGVPTTRTLVEQPNFGTAANMSIRRDVYLKLGGFDPAMAGIEDQDFSMRHTKNGGKIAYLPEAVAIHNDDWLDFPSFCRRQENGMEWTVTFSRRYPNWGDTELREAVNGQLNFGREPLSISAKKILKSVLGTSAGKKSLTAAISATEKIAPQKAVLNQLYKLTLGVYLQKGYRRGIRKHSEK